MAVYTQINQQDIAQISSLYQGIGDITQLTEIVEGIDNSNYLLITKNYQKTAQKKYILTIFESRINPKELPYFFNFTNKLKSQQINCPSPILNIYRQQISQIKINNLIKHLTIVEFIEGETLKADSSGFYRQITVGNCEEVGNILAKMHLASIEIAKTKHDKEEMHRHNDMGASSWRAVLNKIKNFDSGAINSTKIDLDLLCKELEDVWQESRELNILEAPCHLDLFPDNVFFDKNGKISGVIDFYFSANDFLIFDLAIAINAWCFDGTDFNTEKYSKMIDSYNKIRNIAKSELIILPKMLIAGALRFFLSRLKDKTFATQDLLATNLVKIKDPQEYFEKLMFFRNFNNSIKY
jgi:homoserine kinase type II